MELTPSTFSDVEFRERYRGYHPDDVDEFLERASGAVRALHDQVRQAEERAKAAEANVQRAEERARRAEGAATEASTAEEKLSRVLVHAQTLADGVVQEAREQATRTVGAAESQAQAIVSEAEERARRLHGEALADVHAELAKLEATRAQAQSEVDALRSWIEEHKGHLLASLRDAAAMIERGELRSPAPSSTPIEVRSSSRPLGEPAGGQVALGAPVGGSLPAGEASHGGAAGSHGQPGSQAQPGDSAGAQQADPASASPASSGASSGSSEPDLTAAAPAAGAEFTATPVPTISAPAAASAAGDAGSSSADEEAPTGSVPVAEVGGRRPLHAQDRPARAESPAPPDATVAMDLSELQAEDDDATVVSPGQEGQEEATGDHRFGSRWRRR